MTPPDVKAQAHSMSQAKIYLRAALRMKAMTCVDGARRLGFLMLLHDTTGVLASDLTAHWIGDDALAFLDAHRAALVPGRCVDVRLSGLQVAQRNGRPELTALVHSCLLAPMAPSHIKHRETLLHHKPQAQPA